MRTNKTVFVVDDDDAVRDSLKALLESVNLAVETYGSGGEFLEAYGRRRGGCLVLDLHMPDTNGLEVLQVLARNKADLPVISITGRADVRTKARVQEMKVVAFLEKPIDDELLLDAIWQTLATPRRP